jgi:type II secretory pathway predicted ATPase ExeA
MTTKLLALYGLKWNPFAADLPSEALYPTPKVEAFCWRIEQSLVREGGFALITGDPGTGKSVILRLLAERLGRLRDLTVGALRVAARTSTASSATSSASRSRRTTAGTASRPCATAGRRTWRVRCSVPCS